MKLILTYSLHKQVLVKRSPWRSSQKLLDLTLVAEETTLGCPPLVPDVDWHVDITWIDVDIGAVEENPGN